MPIFAVATDENRQKTTPFRAEYIRKYVSKLFEYNKLRIRVHALLDFHSFFHRCGKLIVSPWNRLEGRRLYHSRRIMHNPSAISANFRTISRPRVECVR
jgi:hypothetical protein